MRVILWSEHLGTYDQVPSPASPFLVRSRRPDPSSTALSLAPLGSVPNIGLILVWIVARVVIPPLNPPGIQLSPFRRLQGCTFLPGQKNQI